MVKHIRRDEGTEAHLPFDKVETACGERARMSRTVDTYGESTCQKCRDRVRGNLANLEVFADLAVVMDEFTRQRYQEALEAYKLHHGI